ncbi:PAS domain S-box protein [Paenibacillus hodogayensis]|uniref:histidine kinase n=1 Tax=Paenibacillus hodogayensis TaxID=279208 RepID=A0ABV5VVE1_9BACL
MANFLEHVGHMHAALLESFMTYTSDGIVVVDLDGKVLEVNRAFETLHGWTREEAIGMLLPMTPAHMHDEVRQLYGEVAAGRDVNGYETVKLKKDGSWFHASVTLSPIKDDLGRVIALIGVERDITAQKRAETDLAKSEERYRMLVELSPEPIIGLDDYEVYYANPAAVSLLGAQSMQEVNGRCFLDFIGSEHAVDLAAYIEHLLGSEQSSDVMPMKLVRLDHTCLDVEVKVVPLASRGSSSMQLLLRDVSQRRSSEASLLETEMLYECLVENAMTGVYLYQEDKIVYANPYLCRLFGYGHDEALRLGLETIIVAEDWAALQSIASRTLEGRLSAFPFSVRGMKKDGTLVYMEGLVTSTKYKGKPSLLGTFQDMTYKNDAEEALRESAQRYQRLIKFLPEPIVVSDEGVVLYANKSAMKLFRAGEEGELVGKSLFHFIQADHHKPVKKILRKVLTTDEPSQFQEIQIVCSDGEPIEAEMSSIRIHHYMGKTVTVSVLRDVTDRKQAEEMLIRSEKLSIVGQLAAGLAHEIRNPLTSLKGFTQLLKSRSKDDAFYFDTMLTELERINLIVNDFMTLAKPQLSQFGYGNVNGMLEHVISILSHQAIMMNVALISKAHKALPDIYCDENQLKQVFINLIKNAIEAMPKGGNVTITAEQTNSEQLRIRIRDQGEGIPDTIANKLGEPFLTTKSNGTGLGLMISYRIVEQHHGSMTIKSSENKGTTIELLLPVHGEPLNKTPTAHIG